MNNIELAASLLGEKYLSEAEDTAKDLEATGQQGTEIVAPKTKPKKITKTPEQIAAEKEKAKREQERIAAQSKEVDEKRKSREGKVTATDTTISLLLAVNAIVQVIRDNGRYIANTSTELSLVAPHTDDLVIELLKKINSGEFKTSDFDNKTKQTAEKIYKEYPNAHNQLLFGKRLFKPQGRIEIGEIRKLTNGIGTYMVDAKLIDTYEAKKEYWEKYLETHKSEFRLDRERTDAAIEKGLAEKAKMISQIKEWCQDDYIGEVEASVDFKVGSVTKVLIAGMEKVSAKKEKEETPEEAEKATLSILQNVVKTDIEKLEAELSPEEDDERTDAAEQDAEEDELGDMEECVYIDGKRYIVEEDGEISDEEKGKLNGRLASDTTSEKLRERLAAKVGRATETIDSKTTKKSRAVINTDNSIVKNVLVTIYGYTEDGKPFYLAAAVGQDENRTSTVNRIFSKFPSFETLKSYSKKVRIPANAFEVNKGASVHAVVMKHKYVKIAERDINPKTGKVYGAEIGKKDPFKIVDFDHPNNNEKLSSIKQAFKDSQLYRGLTMMTVNLTKEGALKKADLEERTNNFNLATMYLIEGIKKLKASGAPYLGDKDQTVDIMMESFRAISKKPEKEEYFMFGKTKNGDNFILNVPFSRIKKVFGYLPSNPDSWKNLPDKIKQNELASKGFKPHQKVVCKGFALIEKSTGNIFSAAKFEKENGLDLLKKAMTDVKTLTAEFGLITKIALI